MVFIHFLQKAREEGFIRIVKLNSDPFTFAGSNEDQKSGSLFTAAIIDLNAGEGVSLYSIFS